MKTPHPRSTAEEIQYLAETGQTQRLIENLQPLVLALHRKHPTAFDTLEDARQESALTLLESLIRYDPGQQVPFVAYAQQQLRYLFLNRYREKRPLLTLDTPAPGEDNGETKASQLPDPAAATEETLLREEDLKALSRSLHHLNSKEIHLVYHHYIRRQSLKAIAEDLDVHPVTLSRQKTALLEKLKRAIVQQ